MAYELLSQSFLQRMTVFIWLISALFFLTAVLSIAMQFPWAKGHWGEFLVRRAARRHLDKVEYRSFHNITLAAQGSTTQIDHLFVSKYGVFVLETKNLKGWIFGGVDQPKWTQKIYRKTYTFQNPLRQNYKHLKALEQCLDLPPEALHSVIVFVGNSSFKTPMPENVTQGKGFLRYIKAQQRPLLSASQVEAVVRTLETERLKPSLVTERQHVRNVKARHDASSHICPKCGSALVLRTAKKGARKGTQFWGCSNYPRCRVIKNIA